MKYLEARFPGHVSSTEIKFSIKQYKKTVNSSLPAIYQKWSRAIPSLQENSVCHKEKKEMLVIAH